MSKVLVLSAYENPRLSGFGGRKRETHLRNLSYFFNDMEIHVGVVLKSGEKLSTRARFAQCSVSLALCLVLLGNPIGCQVYTRLEYSKCV